MKYEEFEYHAKRRDFALKLRQADTLTENKLNQFLASEGITSAQWSMLQYLYMHRDRDVFQKDLTEYLMVRHTTVIQTIRRLEDKGYVTVFAEKKRTRISITQDGIKLMEKIGQRYYSSYMNLFEGMDKTLLYVLDVLLDRYIETIRNIE